MATSGTYAFNPSLGGIMLYSFARVGIRREALTSDHMANASMAANMILSDWANDQPNLWTVDLQTQVLTAGVANYTVLPDTVMILDAYISTDSGSGYITDRIIYPVSRTEYASFPDKTTPGFPTTYWFDKLLAPTITLWQPPNDGQVYTLNYYRVRQVQDASLPNGTQVEIPYSFLRAYADALSVELAIIYKPEIAQSLSALADRSWQRAAKQNSEDSPLFITPGLSSYYRS